MNQTPEDRRPPMTPQLALRVAVVGSFALAMFAIIFFRLWFLQVLSGDQYLAQATVNRVRDIAVLPERGKILDRNGVVLADSRPTLITTSGVRSALVPKIEIWEIAASCTITAANASATRRTGRRSDSLSATFTAAALWRSERGG